MAKKHKKNPEGISTPFFFGRRHRLREAGDLSLETGSGHIDAAIPYRKWETNPFHPVEFS